MSLIKKRKKILVISHDKVGPSMAGPGIRYHRIAINLAKEHDVTLAVFNPIYIEGIEKNTYKAIDIHVQKFKDEFVKYDAIIALWLSDEMIEFAKSNNIVIIFDLYAPVPVEDLVQRVFGGKTNPKSDYDYLQMIRNYKHFVNNGDYLLVSNNEQRDFWMGYAFASEKVLPSNHVRRPIDSYFGISPMGIDLNEIKDVRYKDPLSKKIKSLNKDDFVIVWTGGIWDWFDAITPIKAMDIVVKSGKSNIKFIFLGTKHPNDDVPAMKETELARNLANKLGLLNKNVFFLDGWIPYSERIHYFNRANIALYAHKPSIESRFSHRTRALEHILMSLPTVATRGDYFSDLIEEHQLGIVVDPFKESAMAKAILSLQEDTKLYNDTVNKIKKQQKIFTWDYTLKELNIYINSINFKASKYVKRSHQNVSETVISSKKLKNIKKLIPTKLKSKIKSSLR